jgi:hypothetical protein
VSIKNSGSRPERYKSEAHDAQYSMRGYPGEHSKVAVAPHASDK